MHRLLASTALATLFATPTLADTLLTSNNGIIKNSLCVGWSCSDPESYWPDSEIVIKDVNTRLRFDDTSNPGGSFPYTDWTLQANDTVSNGDDLFMLQDATAGTTPLAVSGGAPTNALFVASSGNIGFGTSMPTSILHVVGDNSPTITFDQQSPDFGPAKWAAGGNENIFFIGQPDISTYPFFLAADAPYGALVALSNALVVNNSTKFYDFVHQGASGEIVLFSDAGTTSVGVGTDLPAAKLHVAADDGTASLLVQETNATANPRTLLNLTNNGRPEIVMANTATNGEWSFGAGTDFFLKVGTVGSASGAKTKVFTVKNNGDTIVAGSLTTGGTTCGTGCDRVFDAEFDLPSITDHAAQMKSLGHLPNVGPTVEGQPFNLTDKVGGILNELEHAHLYIAELEAQVRDQQARIDRLENRPADARVADLEARLDALAADLAHLR